MKFIGAVLGVGVWLWILIGETFGMKALFGVFFTTKVALVWFAFIPYFFGAWYANKHLHEKKHGVFNLDEDIIRLSCWFGGAFIPAIVILYNLFMWADVHDRNGLIYWVSGLTGGTGYIALHLVGVQLYIFAVVVAFLPFCEFFIYATTKPDALRVASRAMDKRPSHVVEKELAQALREGLASDTEIAKLVTELPWWSRRYHSLRYRSEAKKYKRARELLDEQHEAMRERLRVAEEVHEYERTKRANHDR